MIDLRDYSVFEGPLLADPAFWSVLLIMVLIGILLNAIGVAIGWRVMAVVTWVFICLTADYVQARSRARAAERAER